MTAAKQRSVIYHITGRDRDELRATYGLAPLGSILNMLGIGGSFMAGGAGAAVGAALAPVLVGRLMVNPRFVSWLSRVPRNPGDFTRHLGRLGVLAEKDEDVRAFAQALGGR